MTPTLKLNIFLLAAGLALGSSPASAQQPPYVVMTGGNTVQVERILAKPDGALTVFRNGQAIELSKDQYARAVGERPEALDQAFQRIEKGETDEAKRLLAEVIRKSAYQSWDVRAGVTLANLELEQDSAASARRILSTLESRYGDKTTEFYPEIESVEWKTRLATGQVAGLEQELTEISREADNRRRQAMAQLVLGDLKRRQTDNRAAVLDYLRTAYFFSDDDAAHAEALYKAADTFAALGDSARANKYAARLKELYPTSEYAAKKVGQ